MQKLKISILFIIIFFSIILIKNTSFAAEIDVVGNTVTAKPGDTVKVQFITMGVTSNNKLGALEAKLGQTDSRLTQIGTLTTNIGVSGDVISYFATDEKSAPSDDVVINAEFKIPNSMPKGEIVVPLSVDVLMDMDAKDYAKTANAIINIEGGNSIVPITISGKSTDATLKSLSITPAILTPSFSSNVLSYNTTVGTSVNKVDVVAVSNNSKATCKILGNMNLEEGTNVIRVVVTAESGNEKIYKIIILKKAAEIDTNTIIPNIQRLSTAANSSVITGEQVTEGNLHGELLNTANEIHSSSQQIKSSTLKWIIIILICVIIIIIISIYLRIKHHY
ncbi:MAG: cadherin-like beta sandwich domain-containing protein [Oscillospiraceae bacterium]|nr:cadherin-like beta sandwich domain-containing protein [Oscillospiraceae bacterium]